MALCGGTVLQEALDLSFDRLLMVMMNSRHYLHFIFAYFFVHPIFAC